MDDKTLCARGSFVLIQSCCEALDARCQKRLAGMIMSWKVVAFRRRCRRARHDDLCGLKYFRLKSFDLMHIFGARCRLGGCLSGNCRDRTDILKRGCRRD